jgi:hypothetical protein
MLTPLGTDYLVEDIVVVILSPPWMSSEGSASRHPSWSSVAGPLGGAHGLSVGSCTLSVRSKKSVWSRWCSANYVFHVLRVWSVLYNSPSILIQYMQDTCLKKLFTLRMDHRLSAGRRNKKAVVEIGFFLTAQVPSGLTNLCGTATHIKRDMFRETLT